jgi:predicted GIY-YIG superfamily endonuclease
VAEKSHAYGRAEKYFIRPRHLYALHFANGHVYIGQTVDLKQRERQHRSRQGGWHRDFTLLHLETIQATQAQASDHEVAWRAIAHRAGHGVYAKPPGILIRRHGALLTSDSRRLMRGRRWPLKRVRSWTWAWWVAAGMTGFVALAFF